MVRSPPVLALGAALAGVALYSLMDALMKGASLAVGAYSALFVRSAIGMAIAVPLWLALRRQRPTRGAVRLHLVRGIVGSAMAFTFFWGIARLPLAEAIALSFVAPLVALYLAAVLLGERIERRAVVASLLGLVGVAMIASSRLGSGTSHPEAHLGIIAILSSSMLYAWNLVLQRQQALVARPAEVAAFQNTVVTAVLALFAPWFLVMPAGEPLSAIAIAALIAVAGAMVLSWAYARAEAQVLVPLEYSGFLWAALFGWLFFREAVTVPTLVGAVLIVAACWLAAPRKRPEQTAT